MRRSVACFCGPMSGRCRGSRGLFAPVRISGMCAGLRFRYGAAAPFRLLSPIRRGSPCDIHSEVRFFGCGKNAIRKDCAYVGRLQIFAGAGSFPKKRSMPRELPRDVAGRGRKTEPSGTVLRARTEIPGSRARPRRPEREKKSCGGVILSAAAAAVSVP